MKLNKKILKTLNVIALPVFISTVFVSANCSLLEKNSPSEESKNINKTNDKKKITKPEEPKNPSSNPNKSQKTEKDNKNNNIITILDSDDYKSDFYKENKSFLKRKDYSYLKPNHDLNTINSDSVLQRNFIILKMLSLINRTMYKKINKVQNENITLPKMDYSELVTKLNNDKTLNDEEQEQIKEQLNSIIKEMTFLLKTNNNFYFDKTITIGNNYSILIVNDLEKDKSWNNRFIVRSNYKEFLKKGDLENLTVIQYITLGSYFIGNIIEFWKERTLFLKTYGQKILNDDDSKLSKITINKIFQ